MSTMAMTGTSPFSGQPFSGQPFSGQPFSGQPCYDRPQLRLTRRGRLVVLLGALALLMAVVLYWGAGSVATGEAGTPEPTRVVMVDEGDTLWGIASGIASDGNTRDMVTRIQRLNALDSALVQSGQRIRVPVTE